MAVQVQQHHRIALRGKALRSGPANARSSAGDEHHACSIFYWCHAGMGIGIHAALLCNILSHCDQQANRRWVNSHRTVFFSDRLFFIGNNGNEH
jgi:hypothetical protein